MIIDPRKILAGAISGALAAFVVDINAWAKANADMNEEDGFVKPFSWKIAAKRWVAGAITGASAAMGVAMVP